ncbi:hypothetical protein LMG26696_03594 [Achromobacter pulmonis]|uniref:Lar family restriction alleviation protein n=1 Tax=Achromobacter pulmonis TaxID=1389932 RepID=UPI001465E518|nr:Lar family restriction alleviation protein [Achromobacter pulmonis]CAB3665412.1 hypothetical protein LMG26696_03594 [Achromobacter pulmonis]
MANELLPCPFCGGPAEIYNPFHMIGKPSQPATYRGGVRCRACGCESKATTPPDGAITTWNRRADAAPQASAEALEVARAALMEIADLADVEADQRGVIVNQALTKIAKMTAAPQAHKDGPWCCERGEAQGVKVCQECAEISAGYQASMRGDKDGGQQREGVVTDDMRYAVRFAPSSAHWSERLVEFFGPDAREGIDALERQLREARAMLGRQQRAGDAYEALSWYAEQVAGCRKFGPDGEAARHALDRDGGERARAALSATQPEQGERDE